MIRRTLIENIPASQYHKFIVRQKAQYYPKHNNSVTQRQETATPRPGQGSVGDLVRGPRRGCMSLGQSGPGQGSVGDLVKGPRRGCMSLGQSGPGQGSVGDLVRGPRRGCMSLGQSGPGQGSDGDPDYTICHECCPILC